MSDLPDDGSFMFTSESVGEGHPGESSTDGSHLAVHLTLRVTLEIFFIEVSIQRYLTTCHIISTLFKRKKREYSCNLYLWTHRETRSNFSTRTALLFGRNIDVRGNKSVQMDPYVQNNSTVLRVYAPSMVGIPFTATCVYCPSLSLLQAAGPECVRDRVV